MTLISTNLAEIRKHIGPATLVAVSKTRTLDEITEALRAGQRVFGENRVQEAAKKFPELRKLFPDIVLHLIGPLQTNKAQDAVEHFDVIQTLDRSDLAHALAQAMAKKARTPRLSIEVNIGREPQKAGIAPEDLSSFLKSCRSDYGLSVSGLMCIPPLHHDPQPYFREMAMLAHSFNLPHLSMGMSADYQSAVACGATEVRIGTALFGARQGAIS